ncbi:MAG: hypothetical protein ACXAAH_07030 [Promethearchaeota archaeon]|jgi:hypothetical protein
MTEEDNLKEPEKKESPEKLFQKGWNNFLDGIKGGFDTFQKSIEDQSKKNKEAWEGNKEKFNKFFKDAKQDWDAKIKKLNTDIEKRKIESKEEWEAHTQKINQDFKKWQEKTKQDWKEGVGSFRKGFFKAYLWFWALTLPILIVVIIVIVLVVGILP